MTVYSTLALFPASWVLLSHWLRSLLELFTNTATSAELIAEHCDYRDTH